MSDRIVSNPVLDSLLLLLAEQITKNERGLAGEEGAVFTSVAHLINVIRDELPAVLASHGGYSIDECYAIMKELLPY